MRLAEVIGRKDALSMQQDFIDAFPNEWEFEPTPHGLSITAPKITGRAWYSGYDVWVSRSMSDEDDIVTAVGYDLQKIGDSFTAEIVNPRMSAGSDTLAEVDLGFRTLEDALEFFVAQEGGWHSWGYGPGEFNATHMWDSIKRLHIGKKPK